MEASSPGAPRISERRWVVQQAYLARSSQTEVDQSAVFTGISAGYRKIWTAGLGDIPCV